MEDNILQLIDMGFPREQAEHALKMTENDLSKSVEFLFRDVSDDTDVVEITNKEEIPDFSDLKNQDKQVAPYKSSNDSIDIQESENAGVSPSDSLDLTQAPELPKRNPTVESNFSSIDEEGDLIGNQENNQNDRNTIMENSTELQSYDSDDSGSASSIPQQPRDKDTPLFILPSDFDSYGNWLSPILQAFCQIDEFKSKLKKPFKSEFGSRIKHLVTEIDNLDHNYAINDLFIGGSEIDFEEFLVKIYELINENCVKEYNDDFFERLTKSEVETPSDMESGEVITQSLLNIQIDGEFQSKNLYQSFNSLFWGKNLENFGNIKLTNVSDVFSILYTGEYGQYYPKVIELQDIFYPELYSDKFMPKLEEKHEIFKRLSEKKSNLTTKLLKLLIFQGRKINDFLEQTKEFIDDDDVLDDLNKLTSNLSSEKTDINNQLASLVDEINELNIRNPKNLVEGLNPYKLLAVIMDENTYFYYFKGLDKWVHFIVDKQLNYRQEFVDFETLSATITNLSSQSIINPFLIYCKLDKLNEKFEHEEPPSSKPEEKLEIGEGQELETQDLPSENLIDLAMDVDNDEIENEKNSNPDYQDFKGDTNGKDKEGEGDHLINLD